MAGTSVLYLAPQAGTFEELSASLAKASWLRAVADQSEHRWVGAGLDLRFELVTSPAEAAARTASRYYALAVVDCRVLPGGAPAQAAHQEHALHEFLELLRNEHDSDKRFPFERVAVLIGGGTVESCDRLLFDAGAHHVGLALRDRALEPDLDPAAAARARSAFLHELWDLAQTFLTGRKIGPIALCAAGGGITGVFYELGVLKCLDDAFANKTVSEFDMYFGISAGAIISAILANGISIDEAIHQMSGADPRHGLNLQLSITHLNLRDIPARFRSTFQHLRHYMAAVLRREERPSLANLTWQFAAMLGPWMQTDAIERRFSKWLRRRGCSNDFRALRHKLYIGATDQDLRDHVLFGEPPHDDVTISRAVQASTAIHPFFASVEINGRRYTDGFVTRTSNIAAAIQKRASLVFVIDPFLPFVSETAGINAEHGVFWGVLQDYKTIAFTRFQQVTAEILRQNPQVTSFTFLPSNRMRRLLARNPMTASDFDAVVIEAYRSTYRRLRTLEARAKPRLEEHGIQLDLSIPAATVERLDQLARPRALDLVYQPAPDHSATVPVAPASRSGQQAA
jgi:NTE family protein